MLRTGLALSSSLLLMSVLVASACSNTADDCAVTSTCPPPGGAAAGGTSSGASAGKAGSGGNPSGGANGGDSGNAPGGSTVAGGAGAFTGGEGGAGGSTMTLPCDGACKAPKPVCDEPTDTCVQCLVENDCATGAKKKCDTTAKTCVECLASTDCSTAAAAKCDGGSCGKCTSNDDCAHIAGKGVCDKTAGECVECTGTDYSSCGSDGGTPLVCDTKARTCTTSKEHAGDLCKPCVSDAQCQLGQLCVKQTFGAPAQDVGFFCFWKKGDTANGAPATCLPGADPYANTLLNQTSIDGVTKDICGLRASTCVARNQFSSKDCSTSGAADDQKCGFVPKKDSKCVQADVGVFRCTMPCGSADDCPGSLACDGTSFCKL